MDNMDVPAFYMHRNWIVDSDGRPYRRITEMISSYDARDLGTKEKAEVFLNRELRLIADGTPSIEEPGPSESGVVLSAGDLRFPVYIRHNDRVDTTVLSPEEAAEAREEARRLREKLQGGEV